MPDHALLYDRDCGLCTWIVDLILRWDRRGRLRPVAIQDPATDELLPGMPADQRLASFHLVDPAGTVTSGGAALPSLMGLLPAGAPLRALFAAAPPATDRFYRWIADNRTQLSRPVARRFKDRARERVSAAARRAP